MLKKFLISNLVALVLTGFSYFVGFYFEFIKEVNFLEMFSVYTSYSCTYLCVVQSRINYPVGAISVVALSFLFYQQQLYSSMILNIYLAPVLIYGWFRWKPDVDTRPVTFVKWYWWPAYIVFTAVAWYSTIAVSEYYGAQLATMDSAILILSILAQALLDNKKLENWGIWAVINVIAIYTYYTGGLFVVAIQYIFFLANTLYGYYEWRKSMRHSHIDEIEEKTFIEEYTLLN